MADPATMEERTPLRLTPSYRRDRRLFRRSSARIRLDVSPLMSWQNTLQIGARRRGIMLDLSQTGLFMTDSGYLRIGSMVHLVLRLPDVPANPIISYAKVVRYELTGRTGYGLRFLRLKETDRRRLARFTHFLEERAAIR